MRDSPDAKKSIVSRLGRLPNAFALRFFQPKRDSYLRELQPAVEGIVVIVFEVELNVLV